MKKLLTVILVLMLLIPCAGNADSIDDLIASLDDADRAKITSMLVLAHAWKEGDTYSITIKNQHYTLSEEEYQKINNWAKGETVDPLTQKIKSTVQRRVESDDYWKVSLLDIKVNTDASSMNEKAKIVLVYLKWDAKNGVDRTKKMLEMYSDDLAVTLYETHYDVDMSNIWCFWEVPNIINTGYAAKYEYFELNDKVYREDALGPLYGRN